MRTLLAQPCPPPATIETTGTLPRVGFLGVGWIGRKRLEAIAESGLVEIAAIADPAAGLCDQVVEIQPQASVFHSFDDLVEVGLDGVIIATPSALHAEQAIAALERGAAVFCQKPLGRTAAETRRVVDAARAANRLLGVDLSYRFISGVRKIHDLCTNGELGEVYAIDLTFHNAYGPDKGWFYDRRLSGGGCVIDLGIHLLDLALWNLGFPSITRVESRLFAQGKPVHGSGNPVEDYAVARLDTASGATINLTCSWKLPAGCDAAISGSFYGTKGGVAFKNVGGSFYNFAAYRFQGTRRQELSAPGENWGGMAAIDWARRLGRGEKFDPTIERTIDVAAGLDWIYNCAQGYHRSP